MKPILPPNIIRASNETRERVTILERNTRQSFTAPKTLVTISATGNKSTAWSADMSSTGLRTYGAFTIQEAAINIETPGDSFDFNVLIDNEVVLTLTVPSGVANARFRVAPTVLLSPTRTLTIQADAVPSSVFGYVTIQLTGTSSSVPNQTMQLRFDEVEMPGA